jgi:hypothetical protein
MIVLVSETGEIVLFEPKNFKQFSVRIKSANSPDSLRIEGAHVWVPIERIKALAPADDPEWSVKFDQMVGFARSKGWVNDDLASVRGHLENE